jgi:hypothetical protein
MAEPLPRTKLRTVLIIAAYLLTAAVIALGGVAWFGMVWGFSPVGVVPLVIVCAWILGPLILAAHYVGRRRR